MWSVICKSCNKSPWVEWLLICLSPYWSEYLTDQHDRAILMEHDMSDGLSTASCKCDHPEKTAQLKYVLKFDCNCSKHLVSIGGPIMNVLLWNHIKHYLVTNKNQNYQQSFLFIWKLLLPFVQSPPLHAVLSLSCPTQAWPPFTGAGLSHLLDLLCWQSSWQVDQEVHGPQPPFTKSIIMWW